MLYSVLDAVVVVVHCGEKRTGQGLKPQVPVGRGTGMSIWDRSQGILCCGMSMYGMMGAVGRLDGWVAGWKAGGDNAEIDGINKWCRRMLRKLYASSTSISTMICWSCCWSCCC